MALIIQFADKNDNAALDLLSSATLCSDICESNGFYYAVGWAIYKELCKINCEICKTAFSVNEPNPHLNAIHYSLNSNIFLAVQILLQQIICATHPSKSLIN